MKYTIKSSVDDGLLAIKVDSGDEEMDRALFERIEAEIVLAIRRNDRDPAILMHPDNENTFTSGPGAGKTPEEVLTEGDKGYLLLSIYLDEHELNPVLKKKTQAAECSYISRRFGEIGESVKRFDEEKCQQFFCVFYRPCEKYGGKIAEKAGYPSWNDFARDGKLPEHRAAIAAIVKKEVSVLATQQVA